MSTEQNPGLPPELTPAEAKAVPFKKTLTAHEAAWYLGVSHRWLVRDGIRTFRIPVLNPPGSKQFLFLRAELDKVLESWRQEIGYPPKPKATKKGKKRLRAVR